MTLSHSLPSLASLDTSQLRQISPVVTFHRTALPL